MRPITPTGERDPWRGVTSGSPARPGSTCDDESRASWLEPAYWVDTYASPTTSSAGRPQPAWPAPIDLADASLLAAHRSTFQATARRGDTATMSTVRLSRQRSPGGSVLPFP
jgi:hypothetical protein